MPIRPRITQCSRGRRHVALAATLAVVAPLWVVACAPRVVIRTAAHAWPGCLFDTTTARIRRDSLVALTIDDGPDATTTPALLDTLAAYGAHATFFSISGQLPGAEHVLDRMRREGHEVGNHFTSGGRPTITLDSATFERDLMTAGARLAPWGPIIWARPGSGWYSQRMVRQMRRAGYRCALGSIYPMDAELGWVWLSKRYVPAHVRPGAVIIMHDRGRRGPRTARVLGHVLPMLRARGYRVVTLSELVASDSARRPTRSKSTEDR